MGPCRGSSIWSDFPELAGVENKHYFAGIEIDTPPSALRAFRDPAILLKVIHGDLPGQNSKSLLGNPRFTKREAIACCIPIRGAQVSSRHPFRRKRHV